MQTGNTVNTDNAAFAGEVTIALAKGRLADKAIEVFEKCGIDCSPLKEDTRKLVLFDKSGQFRFIFVKPGDVPTYVERGTADIGIVGKDTLLEEKKDIYEMADMGFGQCRICVAGFPERSGSITGGTLKVGTKYVNITRGYFDAKHINVDIVKLNGSVELGPVIGLTDVIVDIVESGKTLEANGLRVLEEIGTSSARLTVNKVSLKTKAGIITGLIEKIKEAVKS